MISPRNPSLAALLSLFVPGLGHFYAGHLNAALGFAVLVQAGAWVGLSVLIFLPPSWLTVLLGFLIPLAIWIANFRRAGNVALHRGAAYELRPYNRWYGYLAALVVSTVWNSVALSLARSNLAEAFRIPGTAMNPTLLAGDHIYVAKFPPSLRTPQHEAVVVFVSSEDSTAALHVVKRVIGIPGDTLQGVRDAVYRNGKRLDEPYALHLAGTETDPDSRRAMRAWQLRYYVGRDSAHYHPTTHDWGPLVVTPGNCFVMGDNRDNSYDSRYYGFVAVRRIEGRPRLVYFSYDSDSIVIRWSRIGRAIQ